VLGKEVTDAVLEDYKSAPIEERLRAMLAFLEKLTLQPEQVTPEDVEPLRKQGLSDAAVRDAVYVSAIFNIFDRLADAMGWRLSTPEQYKASALHLLSRGYKI
jgi:uncharacterized peroxidase-related enzyme